MWPADAREGLRVTVVGGAANVAFKFGQQSRELSVDTTTTVNAFYGVKNGAVVAATEVATNLFERHLCELASHIHGDLAWLHD